MRGVKQAFRAPPFSDPTPALSLGGVGPPPEHGHLQPLLSSPWMGPAHHARPQSPSQPAVASVICEGLQQQIQDEGQASKSAAAPAAFPVAVNVATSLGGDSEGAPQLSTEEAVSGFSRSNGCQVTGGATPGSGVVTRGGRLRGVMPTTCGAWSRPETARAYLVRTASFFHVQIDFLCFVPI